LNPGILDSWTPWQERGFKDTRRRGFKKEKVKEFKSLKVQKFKGVKKADKLMTNIEYRTANSEYQNGG